MKAKVDLVGGVSSLDPEYDAELLRRYDREKRAAAAPRGTLTPADTAALVEMERIVERAFDESGWPGASPRIGFESAQRVADGKGALRYFR